MADGQPPEPDVQLLVDPVEPVVNPPVENQNENAAQPQELEVVVSQSFLTFGGMFSCLSYLSGFSYSEVEILLEGFCPVRSLLS